MSVPYNRAELPFLSIIIATLDVEGTLEQCLYSIIQQTVFNKIEILIKDGGSTDNTIDILKKYDVYISYWESSPDTGIYDAWNHLLPKATGEWILFMGADDTLFSHTTIAKSIAIMKKIDPSIDIAYGKVRLISKNNEKIVDLGKNWEQTKKCIKEKMCMPHQGIFHKRYLFERYGKFNTEYRISADYDFIKKILLDKNAIYLGFVISCMQAGGISSDPKFTFLRLNEIRQINRKSGLNIPGPLWLITFINACIRHSLYFSIGEKYTNYILDKFRALVGLPPFWTKF